MLRTVDSLWKNKVTQAFRTQNSTLQGRIWTQPSDCDSYIWSFFLTLSYLNELPMVIMLKYFKNSPSVATEQSCSYVCIFPSTYGNRNFCQDISRSGRLSTSLRDNKLQLVWTVQKLHTQHLSLLWGFIIPILKLWLKNSSFTKLLKESEACWSPYNGIIFFSPPSPHCSVSILVSCITNYVI